MHILEFLFGGKPMTFSRVLDFIFPNILLLIYALVAAVPVWQLGDWPVAGIFALTSFVIVCKIQQKILWSSAIETERGLVIPGSVRSMTITMSFIMPMMWPAICWLMAILLFSWLPPFARAAA
jgi:hypothetical protein